MSDSKDNSPTKKKNKEKSGDNDRHTSPDMPEIDFTAKNFPPFMKVISFNLDGLHGRIKRYSQKLWWGVVSLILYWFLNIFSCLFHFCCTKNSP